MYYDTIDTVIKLFACISVVIGAVECFAGFKTMKAMPAIWGVLVGAAIGVIIGAYTDIVALGIIFVLVCGLGAAILFYKYYLVGIFILITFLTTIAFYVLCYNIIISLLIAILVGLLAVFFIKPVVIVSTSFAGAGIILSSAYLIMGVLTPEYMIHGTGENAPPVITAILWALLMMAGVFCQYITISNTRSNSNGKERRSVSYDPTMTYSERRYPGMQRAYRNFCIKCGCELQGAYDKCPRCGFSFDV